MQTEQLKDILVAAEFTDSGVEMVLGDVESFADKLHVFHQEHSPGVDEIIRAITMALLGGTYTPMCQLGVTINEPLVKAKSEENGWQSLTGYLGLRGRILAARDIMVGTIF